MGYDPNAWDNLPLTGKMSRGRIPEAFRRRNSGMARFWHPAYGWTAKGVAFRYDSERNLYRSKRKAVK